MKSLLRKISLLGIFLFCVSSAFAQPYDGKIIDMFGNNVTVMVDGGHSLTKGDEVNLSYMAGVLEMDIGQYQLTQVKENVFIAALVTSNMPPSKEMKVKIYPVGVQEIIIHDYQGNTGTMRIDKPKDMGYGPNPAGFDPGGIELLGEKPGESPQEKATIFKDSQKDILIEKADRGMKIPGEVVKIMGKKVKVELMNGFGIPEVGWFADLTYVTSQGKELPVGTWEVVEVSGNTVTAEEYDVIGQARTGLKAMVYYKDSTGEKSKVTRIQKKHDFAKKVERVQDFLADDPASKVFDSSSVPPQEPTDYNQVLKNAEKRDGVERKWMVGLEVSSIDHKKVRTYISEGVAVVRVQPNSPADKAGILPGDIIFKIRNVKVRNLQEFIVQLQKERQKTYFRVDRNFKQRKIKVKLKRIK